MSSAPEGHSGIVKVCTYLPERRLTSEAMCSAAGVMPDGLQRLYGMLEKRVAGDDEHPSDMGLNVARQVLRETGTSPLDVALIIFCNAGGVFDYRAWSPATRLQHELGASNAFVFETLNGCNGANLALQQASQFLAARREGTCALVVSAEKSAGALDYQDPRGLSMFHLGDGAAAALVRRGHPSARVMGYAARTDGRLHDFMLIPSGGTREPIVTRESRAPRVGDPLRVQRELGPLFVTRYREVVEASLAQSGHSLTSLRWLITNQTKRDLRAALVDVMGLVPERLVVTIEKYGHVGACDTLIGLERVMSAGELGPGETAVLASAASGFTWGAQTIIG